MSTSSRLARWGPTPVRMSGLHRVWPFRVARLSARCMFDLLAGRRGGGGAPFSLIQVVVALIVTAVARFFIPLFATDQGESRFQARTGLIHMILAVLAFGGLVWAAMGLWATLKHYPAWHSVKAFLNIVPWVMLGSVIAVVLAIRGPRLKPFFGAFEHLFYVFSLAWLFVVSII